MDGTLYDEYEFVIQPYKKISELFFNNEQVFLFLCNRWLEKAVLIMNFFMKYINFSWKN